MCTYFVCLAGLLAALILAEPVSCEEVEKGNAPDQSLCPFVRSAANQTQPEAEASAVLPAQEGFDAAGTDAWPARPEEKFSSPHGPQLPAARKIIESLLADNVFFKDLAPQQRTLISHLLARCGVAASAPSLPASVFQQFDASQRSTFVGITHALLHTILEDSQDGRDLGDVLRLVEELLDI